MWRNIAKIDKNIENRLLHIISENLIDLKKLGE